MNTGLTKLLQKISGLEFFAWKGRTSESDVKPTVISQSKQYHQSFIEDHSRHAVHHLK